MKLNGKIILCYGKCCEVKYLKNCFFIDWQVISTCIMIVVMETFHYWQIFDENTLGVVLQWYEKNSKKKLRHINMIIGNRFYVISDHIKWKSL